MTATKSFSGRLTKGAGTHLASWLQEVSNIPQTEARSWLEQPIHPKTAETLASLKRQHGKNAGHPGKIVDVSFSGELVVTKEVRSMRLWRARDGTLLRVVSACKGDGVAFSPTGQNIVTGNKGDTSEVTVWGAAGGSAVGCGKTKITAGKA